VGTFLAWNADSLVMESNGDTLVVPLDSVITLAVKPPQAMVKGAAAGFGLGATIGGIVGALAGLDVETSVEQQQFDCDIIYGGCRTRTVNEERTALSGGNVVMGALIGGGLGIFMGATLGANSWVAVSPGRLGLNVRPRRGGTLGLGASVRF
jgi:hypothetical protein